MLIRRLLFIVVIGLGGFGLCSLSVLALAQRPEKSAETTEAGTVDANKWMEIKLRSSQEILAALARGDAKAIETNARRMLVLNFLEQWKTKKAYVDHSDYDAQLNAFEYATKELVRTGKGGNIEGALEAYGLLTKSCVKCHQVIRDAGTKK